LVSQASQKQAQDSSGFARHLARALREGTLFIVGAIALYLLIALLTYHPGDPGWSYSGPTGEVRNSGGVAGAWFADIALYLFGYMAFLFPLLIAYAGWLTTRRTLPDGAIDWPHLTLRLIGFVVTMTAGSSLARLHFVHPTLSMPLNAGGVLGDVVGGALVGAFSFFGATLFLLALFLTGVTLATGLSWFGLMELTGRTSLGLLGWLRARADALGERLAGRRARRDRERSTRNETRKRSKRTPTRIEPVVKKIEVSERVERERQVPLFQPEGGALPPLALLNGPPPAKGGYTTETLEAMSRQVELKLRDFGIEVEVDAVHPGPVITRFELRLAAGTKVSRISNLAKDLARALSVISVRIVEVIPGKPVIGLEIPNERRETVVLSEILNSKTFDKAGGPLTLALGKDISGNPFVAELSKMPHLLVAGTTGSGKSVALNALILSLLYKQSPEHVRLIMIDPKMLELSVYDGIGHLLTPVVTDMKEAGNALRWCVAEMERRYRLMATLGVRNIAGFNRKVREAAERGAPLTDPLFNPAEYPDEEPPALEPLCYIVVVVDEFADMMMIVGKKVEELIARLAQKARAAGIHLILATQRPSVDVITGLIKANIPSRIAFQVSSRIDSRTILDQQGAEQLLGQGDMLYLPPGSGIPHRIHGAFVADDEVHKVVRHLRSLGAPVFVDGITDGSVEIPGMPGEGGGNGGDDAESDPLYDAAVAIVAETRRASVSGIQRRLKVGYNRAARMVEAMEQAGVVGPLEANGQREVLIPPPPKG
jgi:S-DNA-T family DNA segregation ATPase FtsK/SpoIIIE